MKLWLILFIIAALTSIFLFSWLIFDSINRITTESDIPQKAVMGKEVWQKEGCIECHALFGNGGYHAPDLTNVFSNRGEDWLWEFFLTPKPMRPHQRRKHSALSWSETEKVVEYFRYINTINTLDWPPEPLIKLPPKNNRGGE